MLTSLPHPTLTCCSPLAGIIPHQKHEGVGQIVDMQEFPPRLSGSPNLDLGRARKLGLVCLSEQRWNDVAAPQIVTVARAIEIGRLRGDVIAIALPPIPYVPE
jgi:hypothetical protein